MAIINSLLNWIKNNKFSALLLLVVFYLVWGQSVVRPFGLSTSTYPQRIADVVSMEAEKAPSLGFGRSGSGIVPPLSDFAPAPEEKERMVQKESHQSLLVKDVHQSLQAIKDHTQSLGGYMVESYLSDPQEAGSGQISVRIPEQKFDDALSYFRSLALRVVSENIKGTDVTDEYVDLKARLAVLDRNKARFEEIMEEAKNVDEILRVQEKVFDLQAQIDDLLGRQKYLEQTSAMSKLNIFLSTDELSLPYAPSEPWRPEVIFKRAVRSLVGNLQDVGTALVWIAVYSLIWLPLLLIYLYWTRVRVRSQGKSSLPSEKDSSSS